MMSRASYVNPPELLTPLGEWIASRLPHAHYHRWSSGVGWCYRIHGLKPEYRFCIFNLTVARLYTGKPAWIVVQVCGLTLFERNAHLSGRNAQREKA